MKSITISFISCFSAIIMWQLNILTSQSINAITDSVNYIGDVTKEGFKYSLTFFENTHERNIYNIKKQKEKNDLYRKIRIETLESDLEETNLVFEKSIPNYHKYLTMFGDNIYSQYELAYQIVLMKDTLFVSESLGTLSILIKENLEKQFQIINMDNVVNKMIEKNIYNDILFELYIQQMQVKNMYNDDKNSKLSSLYILKESIDSYESAWAMNISNEFFKLANYQNNNLTYITDHYKDTSQQQIYLEYNNNDLVKKKSNRYFYNNNDNDPKCLQMPLSHSIWEQHNLKY